MMGNDKKLKLRVSGFFHISLSTQAPWPKIIVEHEGLSCPVLLSIFHIVQLFLVSVAFHAEIQSFYLFS